MTTQRLKTVALLLLAVVALAASAGAAGGGAAPVRVSIFVSRGDPGSRCDRVVPLPRLVRAPAVLTGALRALLAGPTAAERRRGYGGWFSAHTAGSLRSVRLAGGIAYVDFVDFSHTIPSASSSCGGALLLAQLDRTVTQFPGVRRGVYSFSGSRTRFYEWLQLAPPT